jgi:hypothetical protein
MELATISFSLTIILRGVIESLPYTINRCVNTWYIYSYILKLLVRIYAMKSPRLFRNVKFSAKLIFILIMVVEQTFTLCPEVNVNAAEFP